MKVDDIVALKNRKGGDPRNTGRVCEIFDGNTHVCVWWTMSNQDDETPPGIMIQTELIANLRIINESEKG